jgi:hypothetical protein
MTCSKRKARPLGPGFEKEIPNSGNVISASLGAQHNGRAWFYQASQQDQRTVFSQADRNALKSRMESALPISPPSSRPNRY